MSSRKACRLDVRRGEDICALSGGLAGGAERDAESINCRVRQRREPTNWPSYARVHVLDGSYFDTIPAFYACLLTCCAPAEHTTNAVANVARRSAVAVLLARKALLHFSVRCLLPGNGGFILPLLYYRLEGMASCWRLLCVPGAWRCGMAWLLALCSLAWRLAHLLFSGFYLLLSRNSLSLPLRRACSAPGGGGGNTARLALLRACWHGQALGGGHCADFGGAGLGRHTDIFITELFCLLGACFADILLLFCGFCHPLLSRLASHLRCILRWRTSFLCCSGILVVRLAGVEWFQRHSRLVA